MKDAGERLQNESLLRLTDAIRDIKNAVADRDDVVVGNPFEVKWVRMAGLRYEVVIENNSGKGPKKKSPWIIDGDVCMGDSELIIEYLRSKYQVDPDAHLTKGERALSLAWLRLLEEHYHQPFEWALLLGDGSAQRLKAIADGLPFPMGMLFPRVFPPILRKQLYARGVGRHSPEDIVKMGKADLDALSEFLGSKPYFLGDKPATLDASAFGFLSVSIWALGSSVLFEHARSLPNLVAYCERMRDRYYKKTS